MLYIWYSNLTFMADRSILKRIRFNVMVAALAVKEGITKEEARKILWGEAAHDIYEKNKGLKDWSEKNFPSQGQANNDSTKSD